MNEKMEVYLHIGGKKSPELLIVSSDCTFGDLLTKASGIDYSVVREWFIMLEDSDEEQDHRKLISEAGVKNRSHIHCHRCKKIEVAVLFNGRTIKDNFPPSAKVKRILKWAVREFGISDEEATDYVLTLEDGTEINDRDSIGMYVDFPHCHITLILTRKVAING